MKIKGSNGKSYMDIEKTIVQSVHRLYWDEDINCARTTLVVLADLMGLTLDEQVLQARIGMHGAGGFRAQCGLVEGGLMFFGIYLSHQGKPAGEIADFCYHYAESFQECFGSIVCKELRPGGFREDDPPHRCEELTSMAIQFTYEFLVNDKHIGEGSHKDWLRK